MKTKKSNKIFFVRHAQTHANLGASFDKPQHIRLTEKGEKDARELVKKIKKPSLIIVSRFFRTIDTAEPAMQKYKDIHPIILPEIHEFNYLDPKKFIGENIDKKKIIAEYWEKMDPHHNDGTFCESFFEFAKRLHISSIKLKKMISKEKGNVYVFSHGNFIKAFLLLHHEFKDLFKNKKVTNNKIKDFMQRFYEVGKDKNFDIDNCQILEITDKLKKYKH